MCPFLHSQLLDFSLVENGHWSEEASDCNMGSSELICKAIDDQLATWELTITFDYRIL